MKRMSSSFDKAMGMEPNDLTEHAKGCWRLGLMSLGSAMSLQLVVESLR